MSDKPSTKSTVGSPVEQSIEELQQRYEKLHKKQIQADTQCEVAKKRVDELKAQAREKYGTDDLTELQKKLDELIAENAQKRAKYQQDLDKIETDLAAVEMKFADTTGATQASPRR